MEAKTKLIIKYFIEQKIEEISSIVTPMLYIFTFILFTTLIGHLALLSSPGFFLNVDGEQIVGFTKMILEFLFGIILDIYLILIFSWLDDNWKRAKKRAEKDLRVK